MKFEIGIQSIIWWPMEYPKSEDWRFSTNFLPLFINLFFCSCVCYSLSTEHWDPLKELLPNGLMTTWPWSLITPSLSIYLVVYWVLWLFLVLWCGRMVILIQSSFFFIWSFSFGLMTLSRRNRKTLFVSMHQIALLATIPPSLHLNPEQGYSLMAYLCLYVFYFEQLFGF